MSLFGKSAYECMSEFDDLDNQQTDDMRKTWPVGTSFIYLGRRCAITRYETASTYCSHPGGMFFDYVAEDGIIRGLHVSVSEYASFRKIAMRDSA